MKQKETHGTNGNIEIGRNNQIQKREKVKYLISKIKK
jgi:hypothetical protein